ncbi:MAG: redoxin domain-containing protein [Armatimonadota bacterium]
MALEVGTKAPDFDLPVAGGDKTGLWQLMGTNDYVVLAFYPKAKTSVCTEEITMLDEFRPELHSMGAEVVGISVDDIETLEAWIDETGFTIPLLSDGDPRGVVAEMYDVMSDNGVSERAYFIIDDEGTIRYSYVSPMSKNPGIDRLITVLEELQEAQ